MKTKNKITTLCLSFMMMIGVLFVGTASPVSAATGPAPSDWAFEESSRPLNDAIVEAYPTLGDANGYVTIPLANAMTGSLDVTEKGITGTLNGIENFTNLIELKVNKNQISGEIPADIGNMTSLKYLYLGENKLSGTIPSSFSNLTSLLRLYIQVNNFSGNIDTLQNLPLSYLSVADNPNLTGNPAVTFASNTTLIYLNISDSSLLQISPEIPTLGYTVGTFKYNNLADELLSGGKTTLADGVTQDTIDKAQESADFITDPVMKQQWQDDINLAQQMLDAKDKVDTLLVTPDLNDVNAGITEQDVNDAQDLVTALPDGSLKDELQAKIDTAKNILDAKGKVDELLTTPDNANLKDGVDKAKVDEAQDAVNKLPAGDLKDELQAKVDTAKNLLDAKEKTDGLVNPDGSLGAGVDQGKIDEAQNAVNKLPDGTTKTELQKIIDEAQKLLDAKNSTSESSRKPTVSGGDEVSKGAVSTGDTTNVSVLSAMLGISLVGLVVFMKRKKQAE